MIYLQNTDSLFDANIGYLYLEINLFSLDDFLCSV